MIDIIPPCEVKGIHHIGIAVSDINLASQYYQTTFNIKEAPTLENYEFSVLGIFLPVNGVHLELLQGTNPDSLISKFIAEKGEGIHHLCFEVDDIQKSIDTLLARDIKLLDTTPRQGFIGPVAFLHPKSSRGVLVELAQHE